MNYTPDNWRDDCNDESCLGPRLGNSIYPAPDTAATARLREEMKSENVKKQKEL